LFYNSCKNLSLRHPVSDNTACPMLCIRSFDVSADSAGHHSTFTQ